MSNGEIKLYTAEELNSMCLEALREARVKMETARWSLALEGEDEETQRAASRCKLDVHQAIMKLENAALSDIRDQLEANESALLSGRADLLQALEHLADVQRVINSVTSLLGTIGNIVGLLA